ncbi:MAG: ATP phosphoribosyltransferase, partial [Paenibacillaceae bacterium]|nr:ATP phosphoribosyltransferase [Paenibacillaceae bacterium]
KRENDRITKLIRDLRLLLQEENQ